MIFIILKYDKYQKTDVKNMFPNKSLTLKWNKNRNYEIYINLNYTSIANNIKQLF